MNFDEKFITLYGISCNKAEGKVCVNPRDETSKRLSQLYIEKTKKRDKLRDELAGVLTNLEIKYQRHELSEDEELIRQAWDGINFSIEEMETIYKAQFDGSVINFNDSALQAGYRFLQSLALFEAVYPEEVHNEKEQ